MNRCNQCKSVNNVGDSCCLSQENASIINEQWKTREKDKERAQFELGTERSGLTVKDKEKIKKEKRQLFVSNKDKE